MAKNDPAYWEGMAEYHSKRCVEIKQAWNADAAFAFGEIQSLKAENARLREALEKIADEKIIGTLYPTQIARAALARR